MRYFRTENNELVNMLDHTVKMISDNSNVRIYIGTDSQNYAGVTKFVTWTLLLGKIHPNFLVY